MQILLYSRQITINKLQKTVLSKLLSQYIKQN